jgi:uncharacterized protein RhaS with RHS repeats
MGCETLPIEYYESLAEKGSSSLFLSRKPLHKKTPIGDFFNIAILCLRYFNPLNGKWLSRDPITEKGGLNLYGFIGNNGVNRWNSLGLAYFAYRPLGGILSYLGVWDSKLDDKLNTVIGHEQLFFEAQKSPSNIGFMNDGTLHTESDTSKYCIINKSGYNDCVMRKAINAVPLKPYSLFGRLGKVEKNNCQDWAVRQKYKKLIKDSKIKKECCVNKIGD